MTLHSIVVKIGSYIPLDKLNNAIFNKILKKKNTGITILYLRNQLFEKYISTLYKKVINEVESYAGNNAIRISADQKIDKCNRYIAHLICGKYSIEPSHPHLIYCRELENVDSSNNVRLINDCLRNI